MLEPAPHLGDPEVPDRPRRLGTERGHLLAQAHHVLWQRVDVTRRGRRAAQPDGRDAQRGQGDHQAEHGEEGHASQTTMLR